MRLKAKASWPISSRERTATRASRSPRARRSAPVLEGLEVAGDAAREGQDAEQWRGRRGRGPGPGCARQPAGSPPPPLPEGARSEDEARGLRSRRDHHEAVLEERELVPPQPRREAQGREPRTLCLGRRPAPSPLSSSAKGIPPPAAAPRRGPNAPPRELHRLGGGQGILARLVEGCAPAAAAARACGRVRPASSATTSPMRPPISSAMAPAWRRPRA